MAISRAGSLDAMVEKTTTVATEEELPKKLYFMFLNLMKLCFLLQFS